MIRLFKDLIGFTVFACVIWVASAGLTGLFGPKWMHKNVSYVLFNANGQTFTRFQDVHNFKDVDVLVCGSSHAYRGFDPRIFEERGYSLFNLGSSGQTPVQSYYLLKRYLADLNPKLVIIETFPNTLSNDGLSSKLDILPKTPFNLDKIEMSLRLNRIHSYNTLAANAFDSFLGFSDYDNSVEDSIYNGSLYLRGGYCEYQKSKIYDGSFERESPRIMGIKSFQKEALLEMVELVQEADARLIFVETPVTEKYSELVFLNKKARAQLLDMSAEHQLNYNDSFHIPYPDSVFYDPHHMRQPGVDRFNRELIDDLEELGLLRAE